MLRLNSGTDSDPLGDVLRDVRFRSTVFCRSEMRAPWGFAVQGRDIASFHFVETGACLLEVSDAGFMTHLQSGDFVILPHGHAHLVRDRRESPVTRLDDLVSQHFDPVKGALRFGGDGEQTSLICGGLIFEDRNALPFLSALPPVIHLSERSERVGGWLKIALDLLSGQHSPALSGDNTILTRIADLLFIEAVRLHFSDSAGSARGWFAALTDRHVGQAISLMHRELNRPWTVRSLAEAVGLSRTAFAMRFSELLGQSPIRYLASYRITRATALLESNSAAIAKVAMEVGYESEFAFSKAFRRHVGMSPGDYRRARQSRRSGQA